MEREYINKFLDMSVSVGVPNYTDPEKLFFYHGKLTYIGQTNLIIENDKGSIEVELDRVKAIVLDRRG